VGPDTKQPAKSDGPEAARLHASASSASVAPTLFRTRRTATKPASGRSSSPTSRSGSRSPM
jgi:hypothetical protein